MDIGNLQDALTSCFEALKNWLVKRQQTIDSIEKILKEISEKAKFNNKLRVAGAGAATVAGAISLLTLGIATPIAIALGSAAVYGGVMNAGGEMANTQLKKLVTEAENKFDNEISEYIIAIESLTKLYEMLSKKEHTGAVSASEREISKIQEGLRKYAETNEQCDKLKGMVSTLAREEVTKQAHKRGLEANQDIVEAVTKTGSDQAIKWFLRGVSEAAAKSVAEEATKAAAEAAFSTASTGHGQTVNWQAIGTAAELAAEQAVESAVKTMGKASVKMGGKMARVAVRAMPVLSLAFIAWDAHDAVDSYQELVGGSGEEQQLIGKIADLKNEITIIINYYNSLQGDMTMKINTP